MKRKITADKGGNTAKKKMPIAIQPRPIVRNKNTSNVPMQSSLKEIKKILLLAPLNVSDRSNMKTTTQATPVIAGQSPASSNKQSIKILNNNILNLKTANNPLTELEKTLNVENQELKVSLDKNKEGISNQINYYEKLLKQEREDVERYKAKLCKAEAEKEAMARKYSLQSSIEKNKERATPFDKLHSTSGNFDHNEIQLRLNDANLKLKNKETKYKANLLKCISEQEQLKSNLDGVEALCKVQTEEGLRKLLLNFSVKHLNQTQASWLEAQLMSKEDQQNGRWPQHFKNLVISLICKSKKAYSLYQRAFGLPPMPLVEKWIEESVEGVENFSSTINSIFEEAFPIEKNENISMGVERHIVDGKIEYKEKGNLAESIHENVKMHSVGFSRIEEGRACDEEAVIVFSDSDPEDEACTIPSIQNNTDNDQSSQHSTHTKIPPLDFKAQKCKDLITYSTEKAHQITHKDDSYLDILNTFENNEVENSLEAVQSHQVVLLQQAQQTLNHPQKKATKRFVANSDLKLGQDVFRVV